MTNKSLATELKKWRSGKGLTLSDAEYQTKINRATLQRYETREGGIPNGDNMLRIAKALNVTTDEVLEFARFDKEYRTKQKDQQV